MDIDGLGEEVAIQLVDSGLVKSIPDLYRLTKKQLLTLDKFADQRAQNLLDGIARSKDRGLARLCPRSPSTPSARAWRSCWSRSSRRSTPSSRPVRRISRA